MIQFLLDYGLFLAKSVTVVAAIAAVVVLTVGLSRKESPAGGLTVEKLNDKYRDLRRQLRHALLAKGERRKELKEDRKQRKAEDKGVLLITHYQRLLDYVKPDFVHVLAGGRIVRTGGPELALELEERGYEAVA